MTTLKLNSYPPPNLPKKLLYVSTEDESYATKEKKRKKKRWIFTNYKWLKRPIHNRKYKYSKFELSTSTMNRQMENTKKQNKFAFFILFLESLEP